METSQATHVRWNDLLRERVGELIERRYVTGHHLTLAQFFLAKGCVVPKHEHESEQFVNVIGGTLRLRLGADGAEVVDVAAGEVLLIPPYLPHSAEALEDTIVFDSFSPTRKDWIEKRDDYFPALISVDTGLKGKVALVAAASKGLGCAVAEAFAAEGASLAICARGEQGLASARDAIERIAKAPVHTVAGDLSRSEGIERVARSTLEKFGRVDVLVTNAGGPPVGTFESLDWSTWQRAVELTLRSAVELTRAVLPGMRERRWGRVLHITSLAVKQPIDGLMLSTSIRSAVTGFSRTLANEVAADGITVNTILPGFMNTERVTELNQATAAREGLPVEQVERRVREQIPMRRIGEPGELAALVTFLASERASYITGQSIAVDGGWIRALL